MLKSLVVHNFALIEAAEVELCPGLNVLTGETGAGKSILIDALAAVLGERASADLVRHGCDSFRVEGVFDVSGLPAVQKILSDQGIPLEEETLIIARRVSKQGRNTITVNGCHLPLSVLRSIGEILVDMHGQHETQTILKPENHLALLDTFDDNIYRKLGEYQNIFATWENAAAELKQLQEKSRKAYQRQDMLEWQVKEISEAKLKPDEEEELEHRVKILANAEKIAGAVSRSQALLNHGSKGGMGIQAGLAELERELQVLAKFDDRTQRLLAAVTEMKYQLEEISAELRDYSEELEYDPQEMDRLNRRLDLIYRLKKKYGATVREILAYGDAARAELAGLENHEAREKALAAAKDEAEHRLAVLADELDALRKTAADRFTREAEKQLPQLGMPEGRLRFVITRTAEFGRQGKNQATLMFSANPGEEPRPLHKVASGGELSRIALAIKTVCAKSFGAATMVFDEIDAGIGGQTAQLVGEKIANVSRDRQVLCVTHVPQIAVMADHHLYIEKTVDGQNTRTKVIPLDLKARVTEIARMICGDQISATAAASAAEMLENAMKKKEKIRKRA